MTAAAWRLGLARACAWSLLLGGWIGVAALADRLTAGPLAAAAVVAGWLLATGVVSELLGRVRWPARAWAAALPAAALGTAWALREALQGGGPVALWGLVLGWATLLALASTTVRALRLSPPTGRPSSPVTSAATGALLTWAALGDPSDLPALAVRLAVLAGGMSLVLAALRLGRGGTVPARPGCRAGLFDCALPAWPAGAWRDPACWPLQLAALVMLPMMWGLPQMLVVCRSAALPAQAVLGLHLAAMFLPALAWGGLRAGPCAPQRLAGPCAGLLVLGGVAAMGGGPLAGWGLALAHGMAWSLAWAGRLAPGPARPAGASAAAGGSPAARLPAPWRAGASSAALVGLIGALQALGGPPALNLVHGALGALAGAAWLSGLVRRPLRPALAGRPGHG